MVQALTAGSVLSIPLGEALAADRLAAPTSDSALFDLAVLAPRLISVETEGDGTASPAVNSATPVAGDAPFATAEPVGISTQGTDGADPALRPLAPLPIAAGLLPPSNPADDAALAQALSALAALEQAGRTTISPRPAPTNLNANPLMAQFGLVLTLPKASAAPMGDNGAPDKLSKNDALEGDVAKSDVAKSAFATPDFVSPDLVTSDAATSERVTRDIPSAQSAIGENALAPTADATLTTAPIATPVSTPHTMAAGEAPAHIQNEPAHPYAPRHDAVQLETHDVAREQRAPVHSTPHQTIPAQASLNLVRDGSTPEQITSVPAAATFDAHGPEAPIADVTARDALEPDAPTIDAKRQSALISDVPAVDVTAVDMPAPETRAVDVTIPSAVMLDAPTPDARAYDGSASFATASQPVTPSVPASVPQSMVSVPHAIEDAPRTERAIKIGDLVNEPRPIILPNRPMPVAPPMPLKDPASSVPDHVGLVLMQADAAAFHSTRITSVLNTPAVTPVNEPITRDQTLTADISSFTPTVDAAVAPLSIAMKKDDHGGMRADESSSDSNKTGDDAALLLVMSAAGLIQPQPLNKAALSNKAVDDHDQAIKLDHNPDSSADLSTQAPAVVAGFTPVILDAPRPAIDHADLTARDSGAGVAKHATAQIDAFTIKAEQTVKSFDDQKTLEAHDAPQLVKFDLKTLEESSGRTIETDGLKPDLAADFVLQDAIKTALAPLLKEGAPDRTQATVPHHTPSNPVHAQTSLDATLAGQRDPSDNNASQHNGQDFSDSSRNAYGARQAPAPETMTDFETIARAERDAAAQAVSSQSDPAQADTTINALTVQNAIDPVVLRDVTSYSVDTHHAAQMMGDLAAGNTTPSLAVFAPQASYDAGTASAPQATQDTTQVAQASYARADHPVLELQRDRAFENQIIAALKTGRNDARVSLYPPQLGQVTINLALDGQKVKVSLKTSNREATSVLSAERNALAFALDGEGFTLEDYDVADDASGQDKNNHHREQGVGVAPTSNSSSEFSIDITI